MWRLIQALEVQSRGMFLMVTPTLALTIRPLFHPPLKLVLPEPPGAAHLKARQLAFPGQTGDGEGMEFENTG